MVPVWLLDIDGVINAIGGSSVYRRMWPDAVWHLTHISDGNTSYRITAAQPVVDFITATHKNQLADIRWHTTWQDQAQELADWLGLPTFPVHEAPEFEHRRRSNGWWKLPGAARVILDEGRPLLWTDDDLPYEVKPTNTLIHDKNNLIIGPDDRFGLSPDELARIAVYLEREQKE